MVFSCSNKEFFLSSFVSITFLSYSLIHLKRGDLETPNIPSILSNVKDLIFSIKNLNHFLNSIDLDGRKKSSVKS